MFKKSFIFLGLICLSVCLQIPNLQHTPAANTNTAPKHMT